MTRPTRFALIVLALASLAPACLAQRLSRPDREFQPTRSPKATTDLGRGVNFGNMLEGPFEGAWGLTVEERFFDAVRDAGMRHIRLPVSWTHHTDDAPPYAIDPAFLDRVAWCVDQAMARDLKIIVNTHHYDELNADPAAETPRALAIWQQIAQRFADRPVDRVWFEVLNEPHGAFNAEPALWDAYLAQALDVIRASNPDRWVLAGPVFYNSIGGLHTFDPPADDRLVLSVHHYEPFAFTHQGATWVDPVPPVGVEWTGTLHTIAPRWDNWSWGTGTAATDDGLTVDYQQGWAGLYFHRDSTLEGVTRVSFHADRALPLNIIVGVDGAEQSVNLQAQAGWNTAQFAQAVPLTQKIILQNASSSDPAPWNLSNLSVDHAGGTEPMLVTQADAIDAAIANAARWGRERGMPVHLGEFGVYNPADMDSRARWTRAVRESAERRGLAWAYWELAAGFGFFDPQAGEFRAPLLEALTD
jgi:endoglucanase